MPFRTTPLLWSKFGCTSFMKKIYMNKSIDRKNYD